MCRPFGQKLYTLDFHRKEKKIFHTQMQAPSGRSSKEDEIFLQKSKLLKINDRTVVQTNPGIGISIQPRSSAGQAFG